MPTRFSLVSVFATLVATSAAQQCYGLDGSALNSSYTPCDSSAKYSSCCATDRFGSADVCLDSGLCMSTHNEMMGMIWQSGCTDRTGKDSNCARMCPDMNNNFNGSAPVPAWNVQLCDYGKYCCRAPNDQRNCCANATAPKVTTTYIGTFLNSPSTATATPSPTATDASISQTASSTTRQSCEKEKRQIGVVGGTLGGLLGSIIVAMALAMFWLHKREKRQRRLKEHYEEQFSQTRAYRAVLESSATSFKEHDVLEELRSKSSRSGL